MFVPWLKGMLSTLGLRSLTGPTFGRLNGLIRGCDG